MAIDTFVKRYIDFQEAAPSPFHVVDQCKQKLSLHGFQELTINDPWKFKPGDCNFVIHPELKTIIAIKVGEQDLSQSGISMIGAHTDSPVLRLKLDPFDEAHGANRLLTQAHGGLIKRSWFDRPLKLAGLICKLERQNDSLMLKQGRPQLHHQLVASKDPIGIIPELAIHLDRHKNDEGKINTETMLQAVFSLKAPIQEVKHKLAETLGLKEWDFDGFELALAPHWPHILCGVDSNLIAGPRHDDLAMVFAALEAMISSKSDPRQTNIVAFFDAEETGSLTSQGAASNFLNMVIQKFLESSQANLMDVMSKSFFISADMAHAFHPSHPDKHDSNHRPVIGGGLVIKENAQDRYATSALTATIFRGLCEAAEVPVQNFVARGDIGCGSTIGPVLSANLCVPTIDVGIPQWGMHSTCETIGTQDLYWCKKVFETFFLKSKS